MSTDPLPSDRPLTGELILKETGDYVSRSLLLVNATSDPLNGRTVTNFRGTPRERFRFIQTCLGPDCREGKQHLGQVIEMAYYFVTTIDQLNEETGVMKPAVYVVIADATETAYGFWSAFVARDLGRLIQAMGDPSPDMPLAVRVIEANRPGKRGWYTLELV